MYRDDKKLSVEVRSSLMHDDLYLDPTQQRELLEQARQAAMDTYAPYSGFPVGAAVLAMDGSMYRGGNIENASYGLTVCAERVAAIAAVSAGHREIVAVAVSAPRSHMTTPCGACRQFLNEFRPGRGDMIVILDDGGSGHVVGLDGLLPRAFGPRNLDNAPKATAMQERA